MNIRIAIFTNYGGNFVPKEIHDKIKNSSKNYRIALAEELDNLPCTHEEITQEVYDSFTQDNSQIYLKASKNKELIYTKEDGEYKEYGLTSAITIETVDTSKPWRIADYDGAEGIEYFKHYNIIDKSINLCEW